MHKNMSVCQYLRRGDGIAAFEDSRRKERFFGMRGRTKPMPAGDNEASATRSTTRSPTRASKRLSACWRRCPLRLTLKRN